MQKNTLTSVKGSIMILNLLSIVHTPFATSQTSLKKIFILLWLHSHQEFKAIACIKSITAYSLLILKHKIRN